MDEQGNDEVRDQVEGLLERHGDEAADELVKTLRTTRRMSLAMFVVVGVTFVVIAGLIVWTAVRMASNGH